MAAMARVFRTAFAIKLSRFSSSASAKGAEIVGGSRRPGLEILGAKDYEDYRKSRYGEITHKALLVDAVGTLVVPAQPMAQVGCCISLYMRNAFPIFLGGFLLLFLVLMVVLIRFIGRSGRNMGWSIRRMRS